MRRCLVSTSDLKKEREALKRLIANVQTQLPKEANLELCKFLFGEGTTAAKPFVTTTYPAIIDKLDAPLRTSSVEEMLAGNITNAAGVTTIILRDGVPIFGDWASVDKTEVRADLHIGRGVNLEQLQGVQTLIIEDVETLNTKYAFIDYQKGVFVYDLKIENLSALQSLTLDIRGWSYKSKSDYEYDRYWFYEFNDCPNLGKVTVRAVGEDFRLPNVSNLKQGFVLDVRPAGVTQEQVYAQRDYPFGIPELNGTIECVDGTITPLLP